MTNDTTGTDEKLTQSQQLVRIARAKYVFGCADDGIPFARPRDAAPVARPFRGTKDSMRQELAADYLDLYDKAPSASALADALTALEGLALREEPTELHLRVARLADGGIALDLGRPDGSTVVIGPEGWGVTTDPGLIWRRTELTSQMPMPMGGSDPFALADVINVTDDDLPLLSAWCVAALMADIPHPVLLFLGEQGTGKSVAAKFLSLLLDPSPAPLRTSPRTSADWAVTAAASWVVALDNISTVAHWFSDSLCRAVTGDGMVKRALYSNAGVSVLSFQRVITMTSIDAGALRGDLAERTMPIDLERFGDRRRTEAELDARWRELHPRLLGGLLDLAAKTLAVLPDVELDELPRMADFARVVAAVDAVLGTDALGTYLDQAGRLASDVLDADPVASALLNLLDLHGKIEEPAGEILDRLDAERGDERAPKDWPTTPRGMAGALKRLAPALREQGHEVEYLGRSGHDRARRWRLVRGCTHTADAREDATVACDADGCAEDVSAITVGSDDVTTWCPSHRPPTAA